MNAEFGWWPLVIINTAVLLLGLAVVGRSSSLRDADAANGPSHPVLGLLTADPEGDPILILCHPSVHPPELYAMAIRPPLPHGTASAFAAASPVRLRTHGRLADGERVLIELTEPPSPATTRPGPHTLIPWGVACRVDHHDLLTLLDSTAVLLSDALDPHPDETEPPDTKS